ncbi:MAG: hypothetical protein ACXVB0_15055 [Mucilaginibacter sp.]
MDRRLKLKWAKVILIVAALYNAFWGILISIYPQMILFGNPSTGFLLMMLRCICMLVGVYGIAYYFASREPVRYWPLILVGLIGKIIGPIGAVYYVWLGEIKPNFLYVNLFNDLIWIVPFGWILYQVLSNKLSDTH